MYIYVYIIYICICIYIYIIHICAFVCLCGSMCVYVCMYTQCVHMCIHMHICVCAYIYTLMCIHTHIYTLVYRKYTYTHIHIYICYGVPRSCLTEVPRHSCTEETSKSLDRQNRALEVWVVGCNHESPRIRRKASLEVGALEAASTRPVSSVHHQLQEGMEPELLALLQRCQDTKAPNAKPQENRSIKHARFKHGSEPSLDQKRQMHTHHTS